MSKFFRGVFWKYISLIVLVCISTTLVAAPTTPVVTDEGAFSDDGTLNFSWTASDPVDGIASYRFFFGTSSTPPSSLPLSQTGTTFSLVDQAHDSTVFFYVQAVSNTGALSSIGISNGIKVDTTAPSTPVVTDGGQFTTSQSSVSFSWSSSDAESGISTFNYSLGTSPGATNVVAATDTTDTNVNLTGLSLSSGTTYFLNVISTNGAGTHSTRGSSDGIMADFTNPSNSTISDAGAFTSSNVQLSATWTESTDGQSGLSHYMVSIGTSAGATDTLASTNVGQSTSRTFTGLSLSEGTQYFFNIQAVDQAGNTSATQSSNGIEVDTSPPSAPTVTDEGEFTRTANQLIASWTEGLDSDSGIARYEVSVGTTAGATDIRDYVSVASAPSTTITGLSLTLGQQYFINVRVFNQAGISSTVASSDGITVDTTAPSQPAVTDGGEFASSLTSLSFNWTSSEDVSNITNFTYSLGTSAGAADEVASTNTTDTSLNLTGLSLTNGQTYFLNVTAVNSVDLRSLVGSSDGITVDNTAPSAPGSVTDQGDFVTSNSELEVSWQASADTESGVASYEVGIGTSAGLTDTLAFTDVGDVTTRTFTGLSLVNGDQYFITVRAVNGAGLRSNPTNSDGITVDTTAPSTPVVTDEGQFTDSTSQLVASWTDSTDAQSGIARYEVSVGTTAGGTDIQAYTTVGSATSTTVADLTLTQGDTYFINVKVVNQAGLETIGSSDGITVDTTVPQTPFVADSGEWASSNVALAFSWSATEDVSAVVRYEFSLGTSAGATDIVPSATTTQTSRTLTGLSLTDGLEYFLNVRAVNTLGNTSNVGSSDGIRVDGSPPSTPVITDEGQFTSSNNTLRASWTQGSDSHSRILDHFIAVGTTAGGFDILDFTSVSNDVTAVLTSLSLTEGTTYFISIKVLNEALLTSVGSSDGILVDLTPPTTPNITDGGVFSTSNSTLAFSWTTTENASGVQSYSISLGTSPGSSDTVPTSTITNESIVLTGLSLVEGASYFLNVSALDNADHESGLGSSDGIIIDTTAPELPTWNAVTPSHESIVLSWINPTDSDFFGIMIRQSDVATPTSRTEGTEILHITGNSLTTTTHTDTGLTGGTRYFYSIFARDEAGNWTTTSVSTSNVPLLFEESGIIDRDHIVTQNVDLDDLILKIGFQQNAEVTVNKTVTANGAIIGVDNGSNGIVHLPSGNSELLLSGDMIIGQSGSANVEQSDGIISVSGNLTLGENAGSRASLEISGGSLSVEGDILVGDGIVNTINVSGGTLEANSIEAAVNQTGGTIIIDVTEQRATINHFIMDSNSILNLVLPSTGIFVASHGRSQIQSSTPTAALSVQQQLVLAGTLRITIPNFVGVAGTVYQLFPTTNVTGTFDSIILPSLDPSLEWVTRNIYSEGSIRIQETGLQPRIIGPVLNYPNPVRFIRDGQTRIGYELNKDIDTQLRIYTMTGRQIYRAHMESGVDEGAKLGYNRIVITEGLIGQQLPAGIYFYIIIANDKIIGKGKMAVQP